MKIASVGTKLFHVDERKDGRIDRQTDMAKVTVLVVILRTRLKASHI
jgi:hypothetical protein